jgi:DNA-binding beta-propeller fold protein YncE
MKRPYELLFSFGEEFLKHPSDVICNDNDEFLVCNTGGHNIKVFNKNGEFIKSFGKLHFPTGIIFVNNTYIVTDSGNNKVQVLDENGNFIRFIENKNPFSFPTAVSIDEEGNYIIVDSGNNQIKFFDKDFNFIKSFGENLLSWPSGIIHDNDHFIVSDSLNNKIKLFNKDGEFIKFFGEKDSNLSLNWPKRIIKDYQGNYLIAESNNNRIQVFSPSGMFLHSFGEEILDSPYSITFNSKGNYIVSDIHKIHVFKGRFIDSLKNRCLEIINLYSLL